MRVYRTLIMFDFHLCPFKQATVASISSISPCRQFCPSILEIDAIFPAPKASAWVGSSTRIAIATRSRYCDETPMMMQKSIFLQWGDDRKQESGFRVESFARRRSQLYHTGKAAVRKAPHVIGGVHQVSQGPPTCVAACFFHFDMSNRAKHVAQIHLIPD
jgi:hypothetical protein